MGLSVDKTFTAVRSLGLLEPRFCVKVLSLYHSQSLICRESFNPCCDRIVTVDFIDSTYLGHVLEKVLTAPTGKVPVIIVLFL